MHAASHGRAGGVGSRLRDGVVSVGELKLYYVAYCGIKGAGDEGVLGAANDDGDDLVLAAVRLGFDDGACSKKLCEGRVGESRGDAAEEQDAGEEGFHIGKRWSIVLCRLREMVKVK